MSQPSLRGRVVLKFPANVVAGYGIIIDKTNSTYTFSVDPSILEGLGGGEGGGIPEAPNDGQQYGRQSLAWTVIVPGGGTGTITNPLLIEKGAQPQIGIIGTVGGLNRWRVNLGDSVAESGTATGSNFHIESYNNDGSYRNLVLHIDRETSAVTITAPTAPQHPTLALNKLTNAGGQINSLQGRTSGSLRWEVVVGDAGGETAGGNTGSDFRINRYGDGGDFIAAPLFIERRTGSTWLTGGLVGGAAPDRPVLALNKIASGQASSIEGWTAGVRRWGLSLGDVTAESGGSSGKTGSDFRINRCDNSGTLLTPPFWIKRDTGTVYISGTHSGSPTIEPTLVLNKTAGGLTTTIQGQTGFLPRWDIVLGDGVAESGTAVGSDFRIHRYNNAGAFIDVPLWIKRDTGVTVIQGAPPDQKPLLVLNKISGAGGQSSSIQGQTATSTRWHLSLGDGGAESPGTQAGSDFRIHRHDDSGNFVDASMYINRSSNMFAVYGDSYNPGGGPWNAISDARIKTVSGDYTTGLTAVLALRPVKYTYKGNDSMGPNFPSNHATVAARNQEFIGLVAQEAETVMPEMVSQQTAYIDGVQVSDMRQMDTNALVYALINAVKELSARVEALEAGP